MGCTVKGETEGSSMLRAVGKARVQQGRAVKELARMGKSQQTLLLLKEILGAEFGKGVEGYGEMLLPREKSRGRS